VVAVTTIAEPVDLERVSSTPDAGRRVSGDVRRRGVERGARGVDRLDDDAVEIRVGVAGTPVDVVAVSVRGRVVRRRVDRRGWRRVGALGLLGGRRRRVRVDEDGDGDFDGIRVARAVVASVAAADATPDTARPASTPCSTDLRDMLSSVTRSYPNDRRPQS